MSELVTAHWNAWIDMMPGVERQIYVTGEVRTGAANQLPKLALAEPQGINNQILILELSIEGTGAPGIQVVAFRPVRFERKLGTQVYAQVEIRHRSDSVAIIEVQKVQ